MVLARWGSLSAAAVTALGLSVRAHMRQWYAPSADLLERRDSKFLTAEQFGMRTSSHKVDAVAIHLVNQKKIAADVALAVLGPLAFQTVIQPFRTQGGIIGDEQQHGLLEPHHVVSPRMGKALPIFQECARVVGCPWQHRALTGGCFFQDQQTVRRQTDNARGARPSWRETPPSRRGFLHWAP